MSRYRKLENMVEPIAHEQHALAQLRRAVVDGVHFKDIDPVLAVKVVHEEPHDGARFLVGIEGRSTFLGTFAYWPMPQRSRHQTAHVLHEEQLRLQHLDEVEELPEQRPSRVLDSAASTACREGL